MNGLIPGQHNLFENKNCKARRCTAADLPALCRGKGWHLLACHADRHRPLPGSVHHRRSCCCSCPSYQSVARSSKLGLGEGSLKQLSSEKLQLSCSYQIFQRDVKQWYKTAPLETWKIIAQNCHAPFSLNSGCYFISCTVCVLFRKKSLTDQV